MCCGLWRCLFRPLKPLRRRRTVIWMLMAILTMVAMIYNHQGLYVISRMAGAGPGSGPSDLLQPEEPLGRQPQAVRPDRLRLVPLASPDSNSKDDDDDDDADDDKSDLRSDLAPATLHFLWCGKRHFEFSHYMAVRRAHRLIRPDKIFFHYDTLPVPDKEGYYLWFNRTLNDVDDVFLRPLNHSYSACPASGASRYLLVLQILHRFGGVYVPEDAILVDFPVHLRSSALVAGVAASSPDNFEDGLVAAMKGAFPRPDSTGDLLVLISRGRQEQGGIQPCGTIQHYNMEEEGDCICVKVTTNIYPKDILEASTPFFTLARVAAYDRPQWRLEKNKRSPIPRIAHYVRVDCEVSFLAFISMLSAVNVAGLHKVYLHGAQEPRGKWWNQLKDDPRFVYVHREYPEPLTDQPLKPDLAVALMRLAILLKYGGVYCDDHVLWTQRIPDSHLAFSAVASTDWQLYGSWPDSVNPSVLLAKKNAPYLLKLRAVLHMYRHFPHWFNDRFMAYKIVETHPDLLFLDRHLQVKCHNHNCHPTWHKNYLTSLEQNRPGGTFSWHTDTLSVHWTDSTAEVSVDTVKYTSGVLVDVCRHVLTASRIVIQKMR